MVTATLAFGNEVAETITASIRHYATNFDQLGVKVIVEDLFRKERTNPVRASMFHKCPKLASAIARDLVKEEFDDRTKYMFLLAHYAAMMAKVAIRDEFKAWKISRRWHWDFKTEVPVKYQSKISGTADVLLRTKGYPGGEITIPVEIKKTSKLRASHVWQTVCYMKALQTNIGIVLTLFAGTTSDFHTWTVYQVEGGYQVYSGVLPLAVEGVGDGTGPSLFSDAQFDDMLEQHIAWDLLTNEELLNAPGPFEDMFAEPCARDYAPPDVYKRAGPWGQVGDNKPGSGVVSQLCPLYGKCHLSTLEAAGFPSTVSPKVLSVKLVDGVPTLKDYGNDS